MQLRHVSLPPPQRRCAVAGFLRGVAKKGQAMNLKKMKTIELQKLLANTPSDDMLFTEINGELEFRKRDTPPRNRNARATTCRVARRLHRRSGSDMSFRAWARKHVQDAPTPALAAKQSKRR